MNRWKLGLVGLTLTVSGLLGCKQQLFVSEHDYEHYRTMSQALGGPLDLADDPSVSLIPSQRNLPAPPTVNDPDREPRPLTLQEAFQNGDQANFSTGIFKPLPTGGLTGITINTNYTKLAGSPSFGGLATLNPSYKPQLLFQLEQPLLQNYGVEINQLNATHPGSVLT